MSMQDKYNDGQKSDTHSVDELLVDSMIDLNVAQWSFVLGCSRHCAATGHNKSVRKLSVSVTAIDK
jgi:hypothetical protein